MMEDKEIIEALKSFDFDLNMFASPRLVARYVRAKTGKRVTWKRVGKIARDIGVYDVVYDEDGFSGKRMIHAKRD